MFLSRHPEKARALANRLEAEGIFLPIPAFQQAAMTYSWRESIWQLWQRQWGVLLRYWFDSIESVVDAALDCQTILKDQALELLVQQQAEHKLSRRWQLQHARFVINRGMYFLSKEELSRLFNFASRQPELTETSAVLSALARDDYSSISVMPARLRLPQPNWQLQGGQLRSLSSRPKHHLTP